jgi:aspartyl-tRNA(Asn)/glutamyl-tRNA(Gln) amidotransferase subunit B
MVNKNFDRKFDQPEELIIEILKLQKKSFSSVDEIQSAIKQVLDKEVKAVKDFRSGKTQVIGFLIGKVQAKLKGKGDPKVIRNKLLKELQK